MINLKVHGQYYELLSEGKLPPKKMRVALNKEGDANWKHLCATAFRVDELPL